MNKKTVYYGYTREVAFEGSAEECWNWIISQADHFGDRYIYRTWTENGDTYYDVGSVYIFNK